MGASLGRLPGTGGEPPRSTWSDSTGQRESASAWPGPSAWAGCEQKLRLVVHNDNDRILALAFLTSGEPVGSGGSADYLLHEAPSWGVVTSTASSENLLAAWGQEAGRTERPTKAQVSVLSASHLVAEIKATLGIKVTELAAVAKVSRQTLYDWIDGGTISPKNYERLFALREICEAWRAMARKPLGPLVHAKTEDGTSVLDLLQRDELDQAAIRTLLGTLAAKAAENEASRQKRASQLERLGEQAYWENILTHSRPVTDS